MHRRSILAWLSLLLLVSCSQEAVFTRQPTVYQLGDEPGWAATDWNDQAWVPLLAQVPDGQVFWSRTRIDILKAAATYKPYGLQLEVYGEYEVFWDGQLIGKNGNPGQEEALGPEGKLWVTYSIPAHLTDEGSHVLALRSSLYHYPDHVGIYRLAIDAYDALLTDQLLETSYMHLFAGAFLIAAIYFLLLYLGNQKEYLLLLFSLSCFLFFGLTMTHFVRTTLPIHYSLHVLRLRVITGLLFGISFLIPLYFSMLFPYPRRKLLLGIYVAVLCVIFFANQHAIDFTVLSMAICLWVYSLGIAVHGVYTRARGALLVLLTLLLCLLLGYVVSFNLGLFAGFSLILLIMLYLLSGRIKAQRLAYETSLVQSTRLRLELLKKNIQPHFLMNTLTSLIDWVEEEPQKGVLFIEALAREFDLLNQIEDQTQIPIGQEIALCRSHLEIMAYRKEIKYIWEDSGIDPEQKIPPAILHTLLENGITHSLPAADNSIRFRLSYEVNPEGKRYTFLCYARPVQPGKPFREGTGLKYVKARLTESYQSNWKLLSEPRAEGWMNVINIYT